MIILFVVIEEQKRDITGTLSWTNTNEILKFIHP